MRTFGKWLGRILLVLVLVVAGLWLLGPREPVVTSVAFDPAVLGDDIDAYVEVVDFAETRLYIERIYAGYNIYRYLY